MYLGDKSSLKSYKMRRKDSKKVFGSIKQIDVLDKQRWWSVACVASLVICKNRSWKQAIHSGLGHSDKTIHFIFMRRIREYVFPRKGVMARSITQINEVNVLLRKR